MSGWRRAGVFPQFARHYDLPHPLVLFALVAAMLALTIGVSDAGGAQPSDAPEAGRQQQLVRMVRQDCGSCHGMTLNGGLGPALTPAALAGKDREALKYTILYGRGGTAMPGWFALLAEPEAAWIAECLLQGFPDAR